MKVLRGSPSRPENQRAIRASEGRYAAILRVPSRRNYETRATIREGLCVCPSCIKLDPSRAARKPAIAANTRARVRRVRTDGVEVSS